MESGVLEQSQLNHLEFDKVTDPRRIPLPDELPLPPRMGHLPKDILKSSTVENLLSQNEDLMARLKVALRRLSSLESDNQRLLQISEEARHLSAISEDKAMILKEKDQAWKLKADFYQNEKEILREKLKVYEEKLQSNQSEIARHKKYQEKIRTQVKPHLLQLKEYARGLELKATVLEENIVRRDAQLLEVREQISEVVKNSRQQVELAEARSHDVVESYEESLNSLREQLQTATAARQDLETKVARLRRTEQRCDEMENENIELRRSKEELSTRLESEVQGLQTRLETYTRDNARLKIESEDLRAKALSDHDRLKFLDRQNLDLQAQLESLRFLWSSRSEESEKLKLALSSLEKINVDLSAKLQEMRESQRESNP